MGIDSVEFESGMERAARLNRVLNQALNFQRAPEGTIVNHRPGCEPVGRNDPCPCGSGKKFKRCCRALQNVGRVLRKKDSK